MGSRPRQRATPRSTVSSAILTAYGTHASSNGHTMAGADRAIDCSTEEGGTSKPLSTSTAYHYHYHYLCLTGLRDRHVERQTSSYRY